MKIAFSTLGCPDWSWNEMTAAAKDLGYDGVELRAVEGELYLPQARIFTPGLIAETMAALARRRLAVSCLASSCCLHVVGHGEERLREGLDYIDLAARLGAPYVRVLGDKAPQPTGNVDDGLVAKGLRTLGEAAVARGVTVLIETNGAFADTKRLRRVVESSGGKGIGVLWDVHHPFRFAGESFQQSWDALGEFVRYLHLKDSVFAEGRVRYRFLGDGDLPFGELASVLRAGGFDGWVSLEWVKLWEPDLEEPGVVFPHFIQEFKRVFGAE